LFWSGVGSPEDNPEDKGVNKKKIKADRGDFSQRMNQFITIIFFLASLQRGTFEPQMSMKHENEMIFR